jgi:ABC-type transport system involved in multi-copper enzyme maturation permease subunit
MLSGLGPVLRYDLITTSRRGRYFLARLVYGLVLLFLLSTSFARWEAMFPQGGTIEQVRAFAESTFIEFGQAQGLALLCLVPALVAGVIADEHQRKTLHYLLASRLSSAEIVLGKLGARLVQVGVFVFLGLPVVCLLGMVYGGLNPENVALVYGGTFTTVLFVSGLSILISTLARRPREALLAAYALEAMWLFGPPALRPYAGYLGWPLEFVEPVNSWLCLSNPLIVWESGTRGSFVWAGPRGSFLWLNRSWTMSTQAAFFWMTGLQAASGLLFLTVAVLGLRPLRGTSWPGGQPRKGWFARLGERLQAAANTRMAAAVTRNRMLAGLPDRPTCGDHPMFWKERYTSLGGGLRWMRSRWVMLFFSVLLGCYLLDVIGTVVARAGIGTAGPGGLPRLLNGELRTLSAMLACLAMLNIAAVAAVSITGEREQDTWVSLSVTLLTPREIVPAKQFGAVWSARWLGLTMLTLWGVGLLVGALHPLGVVAALLVAGASAWLIAALGVFVSTRARNSTRALITTLIVLLTWAYNVPMAVWALLVSYPEVAGLWSGQVPYSPWPLTPFALAAVLVRIIIDATIAGLLTLWTVRRLRTNWGQQ